jgi:hypothetical protein
LGEVLHLTDDALDSKLLGTALAEIVAEESRRNSPFAQAVRQRYQELVTLRGSVKGRRRTKQEPLPPLIPRPETFGNVPHYRLDPYAPPNLQNIILVYGRHQLARALYDYSVDALKRAATMYEAKHPGTKPTNRGQRDPLIAYVVEQYDREQAK